MERLIVVTGGSGFIGSNIVHGLNNRGIDDILVVDNLTKAEKFRNIYDARIADFMDKTEFRHQLANGAFNGKIKMIFHLGACSDTTEYDGRYMMDNNFTYSKELLHFVIKEQVGMVYASSGATYGNSTEFNENDPSNEQPLNVYGYSKLLFDQYVRRRWKDINSTIVGLRFFNVYGPREQHKKKMSSIALQMYKQFYKSGSYKLFKGTSGYENGEQLRDFIFINDVVEVNLFFMDKVVRKGIVNVGTGKARSFNAVANSLIARLGGEIDYIPFPDGLVGKYQSFTEANIRGLRALGFAREFTSLEDGMNHYLDFLEKEYKNIC